MNISNFRCLSREDLVSPEGIYTDNIFTYFVISVESKYKDNATHNKLINDYLIAHDCKFQFYYTDITINISNVKHPYSSFLNSIFVQLNPTLIQKKNIFLLIIIYMMIIKFYIYNTIKKRKLKKLDYQELKIMQYIKA